ncbi:hypothetical protein AEST_25290 [Alishewanella aestuarii B11]|uniref:Uncharacterized protein n=1 Tax=Alishewanella aestuarii B11 TaxID=1197174 RepID=J1QGG3_9ALTE|nr:hypothetical protein AEST_25290 [Alishewanella aestuarii B11]
MPLPIFRCLKRGFLAFLSCLSSVRRHMKSLRFLRFAVLFGV